MKTRRIVLSIEKRSKYVNEQLTIQSINRY